ncbi:hypothetical protein RAS2_21750 [Phycisphaerae bacterium RAS2]|nr:hypothetical protein RAS2_21750 [Phycisphaerae bacterium RAS2]
MAANHQKSHAHATVDAGRPIASGNDGTRRRRGALRLTWLLFALCLAGWGASLIYGIGLNCVQWNWTWNGEPVRVRFMAHLADGNIRFYDLTHFRGDPGGDEPWIYTFEAKGQLGLRLPSVVHTSCHHCTPSSYRIDLPLWLPAALLLATGLALRHRDQVRDRHGHCRVCGYNLAGNVSGRCPECGTLVSIGARAAG